MTAIDQDEPSGAAIVGMACRLPGASSPGEYWANLIAGTESIRFFSPEELIAAGVDPGIVGQPNYVRAAPVIPDYNKFDASFFGYSPREGELIDPQQRVLLEVAWEAFEDAGYDPEASEGNTGMFAGGGGVVTSYLLANQELSGRALQTASIEHLGNDKDFLATRVSYKLNLTGPSMTVQTACSTSLVAVHLACQSLLSGECDMALAAASTIRVPHDVGYFAERDSIYSTDGHCRPFDARGTGTIFGSGVVAVLLKDVRQAIRDRDHIYAVIRGTAVTNDGGRKVSYAAPSIKGQARAMVEAMAIAGVPADTLRYVECHATGTTVGDPLEVRALSAAFQTQTQRRGFCAIGSVKGNIGHSEQSAGLAGLMKAALAIRHRRIPATLHVATENPELRLGETPFFIQKELTAWPGEDGAPLRAGVNSLGIGGTNAFAVLEGPTERAARAGRAERPAHLLCLSGRTEAALRVRATRMSAAVEAAPDLGDVCFTANRSRASLSQRAAFVASDREDLARQLTAFGAGAGAASRANAPEAARGVVFLFSGQGSQYRGMGKELYDSQPVFRAALDECAELLAPELPIGLRDLIWDEDAGERLRSTRFTQPAVFAIDYAMAKLWSSWGIRPAVVLGHSLGEYAAAHVAGVFSLPDAVRLVARRAAIMESLAPAGAMAAIAADEPTVRAALARAGSGAVVAGLNGPRNTVISGSHAAVAAMVESFEGEGTGAVPLEVSRAFHSPQMDPVLAELDALAAGIAVSRPKTLLVSNVTGEAFAAAPDAGYWSLHAKSPVAFERSIATVRALGHTCFLEVGPGGGLVGMAKQCAPEKERGQSMWLASIDRRKGDWASILESVRRLYLDGQPLSLEAIDEGFARAKVPLPTYPFERKRLWMREARDLRAGAGASRAAGPAPDDETLPDIAVECAGKNLLQLRQHRMHGFAVLPIAVIGLEALRAGRAWLGAGRPLVVESLTYHRAIVLDEIAPRPIKLVATRRRDEGVGFRVLVQPNDSDSWQEHATGLVRPGDEPEARPELDVAALQAHGTVVARDRLYADLAGIGLGYGADIRGVERAWSGPGQALAEVDASRAVREGGHEWPVLDACLHLYPLLLGDVPGTGEAGAGAAEGAYLPISIAELRVDSLAGGVVRAFASAGGDPAEGKVDIRIDDPGGRTAAVVRGLRVRRVHPRDLQREAAAGFQPSLYDVFWRPAPRAPATATESAGTWVLFADQAGVAAAIAETLERQGARCHLVERAAAGGPRGARRWHLPAISREAIAGVVDAIAASEPSPIRGVVHALGIDASAGPAEKVADPSGAETLAAGSALFVAQAAMTCAGLRDARVWFVTTGVAPVGAGARIHADQAPVWGLARTFALERPRNYGGVVDLPPAPQDGLREPVLLALTKELLAPSGDGPIALREGARFAARLGRWVDDDARRPPRALRTDGTYLVTGGLGMLGMAIARWLVEARGIRSLVLVGRSGMTDAVRAPIAVLERRGARVRVVAADASSETDVRRLIETIEREGPPLRGVVHGAGVLADGILEQQDWATFTRATAPKIRAAFWLHEHTKHLDLDLFVLQSSFLSWLGSAGQANYTAGNAFLDALVDRRVAMGLPATAINWGPWADAGMAAASGSRGQNIWRRLGVAMIPEELGLQVFAHVIDRGAKHVGFCVADWQQYVEALPQNRPLLAEVLAARKPRIAEGDPGASRAQPVAWAAGIREAPPERRAEVLLLALRTMVTGELGFEELIDVEQPINQLGVDSLMSVSLANRLERELKLPVPLVALLRGPTLEQLAQELGAYLPAVGALEAPAAAEAPVAITPRELPAAAPRDVAAAAPAPPRPRAADGVRARWLVRLKEAEGSKVRLFCFPYAGATATSYQPWVELLHPSIELYAIDPPGRGARGREEPIGEMRGFVDALLPELLAKADGPSAFFGHCMGGLTLFETVRRVLGHRGGPALVSHVFLSGTRTPHGPRVGSFETALFRDLLRHRKYNPLVRLPGQTEDVFAAALRSFDIDATADWLANGELRAALLPAIRADFRLSEGYRPPRGAPWEAPVTVFVGSDDPYVSRADALAWSAYTKGSFTLHVRPADHFMIATDREFIVGRINEALAGPRGAARTHRNGANGHAHGSGQDSPANGRPTSSGTLGSSSITGRRDKASRSTS